MSWERMFVRCFLTALALIISIIAIPFAVALKVLEGFHLAYNITSEAVRQIWSAKGIPEFDRHTDQR